MVVITITMKKLPSSSQLGMQWGITTRAERKNREGKEGASDEGDDG